MLLLVMREIAISKFKATCPAVLEDVRKTRRPIRVTRRGKVVAEIVPPPEIPKNKNGKSWLGSMRDSCEIVGDIVSPMWPYEPLQRQTLKPSKLK
jgi:antitoxin (DNA-binding transcriptional repressor) of toxin-antitoxin stability system